MAIHRPATKTKNRKNRKPIPLGLANAFRLIQTDGWTAAAARSDATEVHPFATRIVEALHGRHASENSGVIVGRALIEATEAIHGGNNRPRHEPPAGESPNLVAMTSFNVGFAVCWLLMTSLNGGD